MFHGIGFGLALIGTVVLCIIIPSVAWFSVPLFFGFYVLALAFIVAILFVISLFYPQSRETEKDNRFCRFLAYHTMEAILTVFRFRIEAKGIDLLPKEPFVLICNHLSRFDPMVTTLVMKERQLAFVSKKENMKIPIVGNITKRIGYLALDRENPLRAMRVIHKAARLVSERGYVMGIYPEGTRNKNGELGEFKTGAFVMAKKAAAPLAVCMIRGTNEYKGRFPFRSTKVVFQVLKIVPPEEIKETDAEQLSHMCRKTIQAHFN
ncbi:MAG: 1-acyl-sn-glycerol-3-phosphate acyltransferase [Clostridia bacterium]|nr:1-acyl-sn-glycerol-3-phosphate acyltransferase [Clostridia bacterium]